MDTTRRRAVVLAAVLLAAGLAVLAPSRAAALPDQIDVPYRPVAWGDATGHGYVAAIAASSSAPDATWTLIVERQTQTGVPDTAFGASGRRTFTLTPPHGDDRYDGLAADGAGNLVLVARDQVQGECDAGHAGDEPCDRTTLQQVWAFTGSPGASPVTLPLGERFVQALPDGGVLTQTADELHRWLRSGLLHDVLPLTPTVADATLDGSGQLLVLRTDGSVTRRAIDHSTTVVATTAGCVGATDLALGAAADGGFATACGGGTVAAPLVTAYDAGGTQQWATTDTTATPTGAGGVGALRQPTAATIDSSGRVWVGGLGCIDTAATCERAVGLRSFTSSGVAVAGPAHRVGFHHLADGGYEEVRRMPDGRVAGAWATAYQANPGFTVWSAGADTVPDPEAPPTCRTSVTGLSYAVSSSAAPVVTVSGCAPYLDDPPGPAPTSIVVSVRAVGTTAVAQNRTVAADGGTATFDPLPSGVAYEFEAHGANGQGAGPSSGWVRWFTAAFPTVVQFLDAVVADLHGPTPYPAPSRSALEAKLEDGTTTPAAAVVQLQADPYSAVVPPVVRLYDSYFLRRPDTLGARYWIGRARAGQGLSTISAAFAHSAEFADRYGDLSNRGFVEQVYQNVLGRTGDPAGIAYWTDRLDRGRTSRGAVMVGFSESAEHKNRTAGPVRVAAIYLELLDRSPNATEVANRQALTPTELAADVLGSPEYEAHHG